MSPDHKEVGHQCTSERGDAGSGADKVLCQVSCVYVDRMCGNVSENYSQDKGLIARYTIASFEILVLGCFQIVEGHSLWAWLALFLLSFQQQTNASLFLVIKMNRRK